MAYNNPTIPEFKIYFNRDFPFTDSTDPDLGVMDSDVAKAMQQCQATINSGLFQDQVAYGIGYNLLTAHNMVLNLRSSSQGINGQFTWLQNSKAVGSVSEGITIPQRIIDNPYWAIYTKTNYGLQYMNMILPLLTGVMFTAYGPARAL